MQGALRRVKVDFFCCQRLSMGKETGQQNEFVEDILNKEQPSVEIKRFSFDVRA